MKIIPNEPYHVYNQGNNRHQLFYTEAHYLRFLVLYRKLVMPYCETLAYCLMPNHFHFMIYATPLSAAEKKNGLTTIQNIVNGFRLLQTSYTQYLNPKQQTTGSRFRQKAKYKCLSHGKYNYCQNTFNYIHQNPVSAGLVAHAADWAYSSCKDYGGLRQGTLCNQDLAVQLLGLVGG
jgi:putative transposase